MSGKSRYRPDKGRNWKKERETVKIREANSFLTPFMDEIKALSEQKEYELNTFGFIQPDTTKKLSDLKHKILKAKGIGEKANG